MTFYKFIWELEFLAYSISMPMSRVPGSFAPRVAIHHQFFHDPSVSNFTIFHHNHSPRGADRHLNTGGRNDQADPFHSQLANHVEDDGRSYGIETGCWLVKGDLGSVAGPLRFRSDASYLPKARRETCRWYEGFT